MTLSRVEVFLNFATWTGAVFYSLYNFYLACDIFNHQEDSYNDFSPGWTFLHRRKDSADIEWQTILYLLTQITSWCLMHAFLSEIISKTKFYNYKQTQIFQITFTLIYLIVHMPIVLLLMIILQPVVFRLFYTLQNTALMWICWLSCLAIITMLKFVDLSEYLDGYIEMDVYLTITCLFWMNLKCFSYFMDKFKQNQEETLTKDDLSSKSVDNLEYFAYCLYLPTLFGGPFVCFNDYVHCAQDGHLKHSFLTKLTKLGKNLVRIGFWVVFTEFALHFIYVNPMIYQIEHVKTFNSWTFYGYGYAMGQYFHLKYVVLYGFSLSFAEFDGIPVPNRPKCIGRIHVYSDMWKHFDRGFYIFLVRYIYIPLMGDQRTLRRQILASIVCFLFVYAWHGIATFILIWTIINLITIIIEKCFKLFIDSQIGANIMHELNLSDQWKQRLHGIIAAPLLAISAMSNSYFFAGREIGDAFFAQFFASQLSAKLTFFFLLYFCCQVSIETKQWEQKKLTAGKQR